MIADEKHVRPKVAVVTVSYGNRSVYFNKVISRLSGLDAVKSIVLVDNLVTGESLVNLKKLESEQDKLFVIRQGYNSGSAKGFKDGIKMALSQDVDFIWLLDDDNLPNDGALGTLISHWKEINLSGIKNFALLSYRPDRLIFKEAIEADDPFLMLGKENSFLGFHFIEKTRSLFFGKKNYPEENKFIGRVAVAPYGGLFFHKSLIDIIELPDESYFLYGDDYDYSYRITNKAEGIFLALNSVVEDLEKSFHLKNEKEKTLSNRLLKTNSPNRIFYSIRNGIIFEQNFVSNRFVYFINGFSHIVFTLIILIFNYKHLWKYKYYIKGVIASYDRS